MRSQGWRASILLALCRWHGEWDKQTARSTGSAGVMVAAAMRHVLATPCGAVQGPRACAPFQWHCSRRSAALVGVSAHRSRHAMLFIIGSDFQVEPKQLEETPKLATMNPSHCVIDCFVVCRDLALPELAKVSITVPPPFVGSPFLVRCHLQYQCNGRFQSRAQARCHLTNVCPTCSVEHQVCGMCHFLLTSTAVCCVFSDALSRMAWRTKAKMASMHADTAVVAKRP